MGDPITRRKTCEVQIGGETYTVSEWTVDRFPDILEDLLFLFQNFPMKKDANLSKEDIVGQLPKVVVKFLKNRELYPTMRRVLVNFSGVPDSIPVPTFSEFLALMNAVLEVNDVQEVRERFFHLAELVQSLGILEMKEKTGIEF